MEQENNTIFSKFSANVDRVKVSGLQRTYNDYVESAVKPLFTCKNFEDIINETKETRQRLLELGIFKSLIAYIDVDPNSNNLKNGYEITFAGVELPKITGSVGTEIASNEGCFTTELSAPNLFGRGEKLLLNGSYSNLRTSDVMLKYLKPFYHTSLGHLKPEISCSLQKHTSFYDWYKIKTEQVGLIGHGSLIFPKSVQHSVRFETYIRDTKVLNKYCPFFIREYCGPVLGNLFGYTISYDKRNSNVFATHGPFLKSSFELIDSSCKAIGHLKHDLHIEYNHPLSSTISLQLCTRLGQIFESSKCGRVNISDMFYLGGPQTLRGFCTAGANIQRDNVSAGAHCYWVVGFHVWSKLPFHSYFGNFGNLFRIQLFYNVGRVDAFSTEDLNSAAGCGLAFKLGDRARIEFNYCVPLRYQQDDLVRKFQFGIGYDFI